MVRADACVARSNLYTLMSGEWGVVVPGVMPGAMLCRAVVAVQPQ